IDKREGGQQPFVVLFQAAIADLGVFEDALQDAERPFNLGSYSRLGAVLAALFFVHAVFCFGAAIGHVLSLGRDLVDLLRLSLVTRVAPDHLLLTVQQVGQHVRVMHRSRRRAYRVNDDLLAVDADMRLGSEVVLVSLLRLMHLRIALLLAVLGRRRSRNDGGIDDRAGGDANALAVQIQIYRVQYLAAQLMPLEKMAEVQDGRLVGRGGAAKIDTGETAQHGRLIQRVLGPWIGQVEPVLQKIDAQHDRQADGLATVARLRIIRRDQCLQLWPRHYGLHGAEKLLPTTRT